MVENWMNALAAAPFASVGAAFIFGLCCGWLIAGARTNRSGADNATGASPGSDLSNAPDDARLSAVEMELKAARSLLDESDDEPAEFGKRVSMLDEAIKRANGRLKLLAAAIKKAATSD